MFINVEVVDTCERFARLCGDWTALLKFSAANCLFLTHDWLFTWWKHLSNGRHLAILTARHDGRLIGILPVCERPAQVARIMPRALEFLGSGVIGSDYLDVIAERGREDEVAHVFGRHLSQRGV